MHAQALAFVCLLASALHLSALAAPYHQGHLLGRQLASSPSAHKPLVHKRANAGTLYPRYNLALEQILPESEESLNMPFMTRGDIKIVAPANSTNSRMVKRSSFNNTFAAPLDLSNKRRSTINPKMVLNKRSTTECTNEKRSSSDAIAASYYPDWSSDNLAPEDVDYSRFDLLYFAFGIPDSDFSIYFTQDDSVSILQKLVKNAHKHSTKVVLSVGGWTGSAHFSDAVKTASNRETFATNLAALVTKYDLDGIDLDWEYPGTAGATDDYAAADSANLTRLLKLLRSKLGSKKLITMAVSVQPFIGSDGSPLSDVSSQAKYLDHILIMNYDVWGASDNPGANAPLSNACGDSQQPAASARASIAAWKAANMPASKILLGLPAYGYVSWSGATSLVHKRDQMPSAAPRTFRQYWEAGRDARLAKKSAGLAAPAPSSVLARNIQAFDDSTQHLQARSGDGDLDSYAESQIPWDALLSLGALKKNSKGVYVGENGFTRKWDTCSNTPFLYDTSRWQVVTYDDPISIQLKARYARGQKTGGFAFWDASSDTKYTLMDAARRGFAMS